MARRSWQRLRLGAAARIFALVALLASALWTNDGAAIVALLAIGVVWVLGELVELDPRLPVWLTTVAEPVAVGVLCGLTLPSSTAVVGALAVAPFTAGLRCGLRGAVTAFSWQLVAAVAVAWRLGGALDGAEWRALTTSAVAAIGFGLIATFLHPSLRRSDPDSLAPYHDASDLLRELIEVSDGLSSSLDPATLGAAILDRVRDELPTTEVALYVPNGMDLTPLVATAADPTSQLPDADLLALRCRVAERAIVEGPAFALPLCLPLAGGGRTVAVVAGRLSERMDTDRLDLLRRVRDLAPELEATVVHLDTALLFASLRDRATSYERSRLAREMHDGLAQDIASLGYLVDAIAAAPASAEQAERIETLRTRISAVVAEVRRSVLTLRSGVGEAASLGAALGGVARHLSESSGVPIHVTLDEREIRLRPEVEAELYRIAQQAMTNAVRHAGATAIEVHCRVRPPAAEITVRDDGCGLQPRRPDSHGMAIMRERATLIGATLEVGRAAPHGTTVTVRLIAPAPDPDEPPPGTHHRPEEVLT
ncbi:sensor histidine kinase [Nocardioides sp.]|uniref:sensor histidine kinase n=1 Tax=Nocardioides sp. TaxID=35761 RepID=UPI0037842935